VPAPCAPISKPSAGTVQAFAGQHGQGHMQRP
jgi:hypothetical protein